MKINNEDWEFVAKGFQKQDITIQQTLWHKGYTDSLWYAMLEEHPIEITEAKRGCHINPAWTEAQITEYNDGYAEGIRVGYGLGEKNEQ